jgi:aspartokinase
VRVLNSRRPAEPGTRIDGTGAPRADYAAVAARGNVTLLQLTARDRQPDRAFAARALQALTDAHVGVLLGEVHRGKLTVAADHAVDVEPLRARVGGFAEVEVHDGLSAVCVVGDRLSREPRLVASAFAALGGRRVHLVARPGGATSALAVVVDDRDVHDLLARLHELLAGDAAHEAVA